MIMFEVVAQSDTGHHAIWQIIGQEPAALIGSGQRDSSIYTTPAAMPQEQAGARLGVDDPTICAIGKFSPAVSDPIQTSWYIMVVNGVSKIFPFLFPI